MRISKYLTFLFATLISVNSAYGEASPKITPDHKPIKWRKKNLNICLVKEANAIENINYVVIASMRTWNKLKFTPHFTFNDDLCDVNIKYERLKGWADPVPLATTVVYYNSYDGETASAEIVINDYYSSRLGDSAINKSLYDLQSIVTHELGHALGLNEDLTDNVSSMYVLTERGTIHKRILNSSDISAISKVYPQGD